MAEELKTCFEYNHNGTVSPPNFMEKEFLHFARVCFNVK